MWLKPTTKEIKVQVRSKSKITEPLVWETPNGEKQISFEKIRWDPDKRGFAAQFSLSSLSPLVPGYYILRSKEEVLKLTFEGVKIEVEKADELVIEDTMNFKVFSPKLERVDMELKDVELITREDNSELGVGKAKCLISGFNPYIAARTSHFVDEVFLSAKSKIDLNKNQVDTGENVKIEIVAPLEAKIEAHWESAESSGRIPLEELQTGRRARRIKASFALEMAGVYEVIAVDQDKSIFVSKRLTVRPKIVSVSAIDVHYLLGQKVKLEIETSEPVKESSCELLVTDNGRKEPVKIECADIMDRTFSLSFDTAQLGDGIHNLLLSITKASITSQPFKFPLNVMEGKIKVFPEDRGWFPLGEIIRLEVLATKGTRTTLVNLHTKGRQIVELKKSVQPFTFTGKIVPNSYGQFVVEANGLRSRKFAVGAELSLRCYKLENNYWKLDDHPSKYNLIIKVDGRVLPSEVNVFFSGRKKEGISLESARALTRKGTLAIYKIPLSGLIPDASSLKPGKYFVQTTAPFNSRKLHVHIPPALEVEMGGHTVRFAYEKLTLKGKTQKNATLRVEFKPLPSVALTLFPARTTLIKLKAGKDGSFQANLNLANLFPGLRYDVYVAAQSSGVWSENLNVGGISLVEISRYCMTCTEADKAIVMVRIPADVKVAIDGIELPTTPLPQRIFRISEPGNYTLSFNERKVVVTIREKSKTLLTKAKVDSLFPVSMKTQREGLVPPKSGYAAFIGSDTKTRTKEYLTILKGTLDAKNTSILILVPTETVFQRQVTQILSEIATGDEHRRPTIGIMPWPTPYGEPFKNLHQALGVKERKKLTPLLKWMCPMCGNYGSYFLTLVNNHFFEFCEICGSRASFDGAHIGEPIVDRKRWVLEFGGKEYPIYAPVLLNSDVQCPECSMSLIPAIRSKSKRMLSFLLCKECGRKIQVSFLLQELRMFPPKILVASTRMIRWLTKDGSRFSNIWGKLKVCPDCGKVHLLSKPLGIISHNVLSGVLRFIKDYYPKALENVEAEYQSHREKYLTIALFKGLEKKLLETREGLRKLTEDAKELGLANVKNLEPSAKSRLKSMSNKLRLLEVGTTGLQSEADNEIRRIAELRQSLVGERQKLGNEIELLCLRAAQAKGELSRRKSLQPILSLVYLITKILHLEWKPPDVTYNEISKKLLSLENKMKEIEVDIKELSLRGDSLGQRLRENKSKAETDTVRHKIRKLEQIRKDFKYVIKAAMSLATQAGISCVVDTIEDVIGAIEAVEDKIPRWAERKEVIDIYLEVEARKAKLLGSWETEVLSHALNLVKSEEPVEQELILRDLSDCLEGCAFIKDWKITTSGQKFLEGDNSKLSFCECGTKFENVERILSYVVLEDFRWMCVGTGEDLTVKPNLRHAVKTLANTGARLLISSRGGIE